MGGLRDKIIAAMKARLDWDEADGGLRNAEETADDILALPEIADGLQALREQQSRYDEAFDAGWNAGRDSD